MLQDIKRLVGYLKTYQKDANFWMQKSNAAGNETKKEVTNIFMQLEGFCIIDEEGNKIQRLTTTKEKLKGHFREMISKTSDNFILFTMKPIKPSKEAQNLMRDFNIAEIALFFLKFKVDRQTSFNPAYMNLIK